MLMWWLVQLAAGAVMVTLFRYQRWSARRSNRLGRIRLDEGFGLTPSEPRIQPLWPGAPRWDGR